MDTRRMLMYAVGAYFFIMTAFVVPLACVSTFLLLWPISLISKKLFLPLENRLCKFVNDHWVAGSVYVGMRVDESGDDVTALEGKRVLFLANHLGLVDHFIIMAALHDKGRVPGSWMWVIYNIWKYTPLGAMWTSHGNFFVNGGATKRERLLDTFRKHLRDYFWSWNYGWIVMYPEGSRLFMIRESAARFAAKQGLPPLKHCVYPRIGAAHAVMQVCAPSEADASVAACGDGEPIEYIVDATLGYPKGDVPDLAAGLLGEWPNENRLTIHYKIHRARPEFANEERLKEFLYECYREKDELLEQFYEKGAFPGEAARPVQVSTWTILVSQLFWIALYYAHYTLWLRPLTSWCLAAIGGLFA